MSDDLRQVAEAATTGAGIGGVAGAARLVIFGQAGGFWAWVSSFVASVLIGSIVWIVLRDAPEYDVHIPHGVQVAICIAAALIARDIMLGLRFIGQEFGKSPIDFIKSTWDALRGK